MKQYEAYVDVRKEFYFDEDDILEDEDPEEAAFRIYQDFETDFMEPEVSVVVFEDSDDIGIPTPDQEYTNEPLIHAIDEAKEQISYHRPYGDSQDRT